jgi:hypothetical protein
VIGICRDKLEKIEITPYSKFKNICIETQVSSPLKLILTVLVAVAKLGKMCGYTKSGVIAELFSEKTAQSDFRPVNGCPVVEVAKIMSSPDGNSVFSLQHRFILCPGFDTKSNWNNEDDKKLFHNGCKIKKTLLVKRRNALLITLAS